MSKWDSSFQQLRRRCAADVYADMEITAPFLFDVKGQASDLPSYIESQWDELGHIDNSIIDLPGRDMNMVRDMLMAASRFYHVIDCVRAQVRRGAMTWAMVDAYHATLVGAKAMLALYGVFAYGVRGRTVLVDFRPELGSVDDAKKFRKANKSVEQPIRVLIPKVKYLEQQDAWALVCRLCNITPSSSEDANIVGRIKDAASSPLSALRNQTLYDSVAWQWPSDLASPRMDVPSRLILIGAENEAQSLSLEALSTLFEFVTEHIRRLGEAIDYDPEKLSRNFLRSGTAAGLLA